MGSDFNGDGRDDILWHYWDGNYYLTWHGTADGSFAENGGALAIPVSLDWRVWGLGDFNGDGRADVLWRHQTGVVTNWLGNADATFTNNHMLSAKARSADWAIAGTGDFNGDGRDDVLWRNADGTVSDWFATAPGGFVDNLANVESVIPNDWQIVGIGDFNGDRRDDILWRHSSGLVTNWLGTPNEDFYNNHVASAVAVPNDWKIVGTGDFNDDGFGDVLWQHSSGLVTNWLGTSTGGFINNHVLSAKMANASIGMVVVGTGDYNGDGRDDVLLFNGEVAANWLATPAGGFVDNSQVSVMYLDLFWTIEPNPTVVSSGYGFWDY